MTEKILGPSGEPPSSVPQKFKGRLLSHGLGNHDDKASIIPTWAQRKTSAVLARPAKAIRIYSENDLRDFSP